MRKFWTIVINTVRDTLRRRVLWVAIGATLVFALPSIATLFQTYGLTAAELLQMKALALASTANLFQVWTRASIFLGIALSSMVISWELQQRTILGVLSRPISRAQFVAAKWCGAILTASIYLAIGIIVGRLYAWHLDVPMQPLLHLAMLSTLISIICFGAVSLLLSTCMSPVTASGVAIFMYLSPGILSYLFGEQGSLWRHYLRYAAFTMYYTFPAELQSNLVADSFGRMMLHPDYTLYARVFLENILYAAFAFLLACLTFKRKQIHC